MDIVLTGISKSYDGRPVLQDVSCRIRAGSICAVMAPSGAGKTTLLRLLLGLELPDSGKMEGVPQKKSALFQEDRLCPGLSAEGNIRAAVGRKYDPRPLLEELGLEGNTSRPVSELSGGMARRAALARALASDSDLLILDEPFNGLDEKMRRLAAETILRHRRGRTLLFVTHHPEETELLKAEKVIRLQESVCPECGG